MKQIGNGPVHSLSHVVREVGKGAEESVGSCAI